MNNDNYLTIVISIFIIILLFKTQIHINNQPIFLHFTILLFIVFLFYAKFEKSAFMTSLLYLTLTALHIFCICYIKTKILYYLSSNK